MIVSQRPGRIAAMAAFSLIEVVLALGVFSFAMVAIAGLFVVGIDTNKVSSDEIHAADFASLLISTRRALPTLTGTNLPNFALGPLNGLYPATGTTVMNVAADGTTTGTPVYNLLYQTGTNAAGGTHLAQVHLVIWWPPALTSLANASTNRYELTTQVALP